MKAIRFQLAPLGSASKVTQDTQGGQFTDPQKLTGGPNGYSGDNQECIGLRECRQVAAD